MGRPKKVAPPITDPASGNENAPETAATQGVPAAPVRRRRRRRAAIPVVDTLSETSTLLAAVLRNRGPQGATTEMLQHVVAWASRVREEGEEIRNPPPNTGAGRGRRTKTPVLPERLAQYEMNRALLEGVLNGTLTLQVQDDGSLLFLHAEAASAPHGSTVPMWSAEPMSEPLADAES